MTAKLTPTVAVYGQHKVTIRPPSKATLDGWCRELGVELPAGYRAFVLRRNGGKPRPGWMQIRARTEIHEVEIGEFTVWSNDPGAEYASVVEQTKALRDKHGLPHTYIVIAWINTPGAPVPLLLSTQQGDKQPIVMWVGGSTRAKFKADMTFPAVATSVTALLKSLDYPAAGRPWMGLIEAGDNARFDRWLAGALDLDDVEPATGLRPIEFAAKHGRTLMVRKIQGKGAKTGEAFLAAIEGGHNGLAKELLRAGVPAKQLARAHRRMDALAPHRELSSMIEAALGVSKRKGDPRRRRR